MSRSPAVTPEEEGPQRSRTQGSPTQAVRPVKQWLERLEDGRLAERLAQAHGDDPRMLQPVVESYRALLARFRDLHGPDRPCLISRAPARINLMGMHIDHRGGCINPIAIKETTLAAAVRDDDRVVCDNVRSEDAADPKYLRREFVISEELPERPIDDWDAWTREQVARREQAGTAGDWSNYVRAPVLYLQDRYKNPDGTLRARVPGMDLVFGSTIPEAAGLSSSSALVVATLQAALHFAGLEVPGQGVDPSEFIDLCGAAEWYVGTRGGKGDHAAIKFGRRGAISHMTFFPFTVRSVPLPETYRIVICNSLKVARKSAGAKDRFNERVACYVIGLALLKTRFPARAPRLKLFRDIRPDTLGVGEGEIYRMLKALPETIGRAKALEAVSAEYRDELERLFTTHAEPAGGYEVRQVVLYGIAECLRAEQAARWLEAGDVDGFGRLIDASHEGDRVVSPEGQPLNHRVSDGELDRLAAVSREATRKAGTPVPSPESSASSLLLWQPGGYDCSTPDLDRLVDIARGVKGVAGAGLVGAGLGGCVVILVRREQVETLVEAEIEGYYRPRGLEPAVEVVAPVEGACVLAL